MKLAIEIAKTHLLSRPKQTIVAMLGVTFGIGMFIALVGLMTGLNDFTEEITMTSSPHIHIYHDITEDRPTLSSKINEDGMNLVHHQKPKVETSKIRNAMKIVEVLKKDDRVLSVAPSLNSQVFYNYGAVQLNGTVSGVEIMDEDRLFDLSSKMKSGRIEDLKANHDGIIIGKGLAKKLNVSTGDRVVVTTPQGYTITLKIVGIFQMGIGTIDNVRSYANIATVQMILQQDKTYITDINLKLKDLHEAKQIAPDFQRMFNYRAEDWETANATFLTGVIIRNIITYSVSFTLLVVAGFGIYNILNMTIYSKIKDIAILKAMGFSSVDVRNIFLIQALVIGFVGSITGILIGYGLSVLISYAPFNGGDVVSLDHLPVNFDWQYYVTGIVFGVSTTALAGYMPSRKAGKVDPIEILRG
jgi:lipoprotein-releasing system permease protein